MVSCKVMFGMEQMQRAVYMLIVAYVCNLTKQITPLLVM